jgi:hypothetical protein
MSGRLQQTQIFHDLLRFLFLERAMRDAEAQQAAQFAELFARGAADARLTGHFRFVHPLPQRLDKPPRGRLHGFFQRLDVLRGALDLGGERIHERRIAAAQSWHCLASSSGVHSERDAKPKPNSVACCIKIATTSGNSLSSVRLAHAYWPPCNIRFTACSVSGSMLSSSLARRKSSNDGVANCGSSFSETRKKASKSLRKVATVSSLSERVI